MPVPIFVKKLRIPALIFLIQLLSVSVRNISAAFAEDDFQYWGNYEISKAVREDWDIYYNSNLRLRDNASELFYHEHRAGVRWQTFEFLQLGFNYLVARNKPATLGRPRFENRFEWDVTPKYSLGPFTFSSRERLELREVEKGTGEWEWRFRINPKVSYKAKLFGYSFAPYVSNDLFYSAEAKEWNQNRLYIGIVFPLKKLGFAAPSIDIHYLLQHNRSVRDEWSSNEIFGTKLTLKI